MDHFPFRGGTVKAEALRSKRALARERATLLLGFQLYYLSYEAFPGINLFDRHALGQVARLIDVAAALDRDVVR